MNTTVQPHVTRSALTLEILVEELRAELANCLPRNSLWMDHAALLISTM